MNSAVQPKTNSRIVIFDYLKAIAIVLVIINHYGHTSWEVLTKSVVFPLVIQMAVPIFMIITGCTFAMSYNKKYDKLSQMYMPKQLLMRVLRFWIPFFFAFVVEVILSAMLQNMSFTPLSLIKAFLVGGPGLNGSYYVPVLIQLVLIFPLIFFAVKRYNLKGLLICIGANLIYEILCTVLKIPYEAYRILMPRYITFVALGCWFYFNDYKVNKKKCILMVLAGIAFYILLGIGYKPYVFSRWTGTCMVIALYIFPIIASIVQKFKGFSPSTKISTLIQTIGNASFHIFLFQMMYYNLLNSYITNLFNIPVINIPLNVVICVLIGTLFYYIEKGVSKRVLSLF